MAVAYLVREYVSDVLPIYVFGRLGVEWGWPLKVGFNLLWCMLPDRAVP
jgi:hypothetical protein